MGEYSCIIQIVNNTPLKRERRNTMNIIANTMNYTTDLTAGYFGRFTINGKRFSALFKFSDDPVSVGNVTMHSKLMIHEWYRFTDSEISEIRCKLIQHFQVVHKGGIRLISTYHHESNAYTVKFEYKGIRFRATYDLESGRFYIYRHTKLSETERNEIEWRLRAHYDVLSY